MFAVKYLWKIPDVAVLIPRKCVPSGPLPVDNSRQDCRSRHRYATLKAG